MSRRMKAKGAAGMRFVVFVVAVLLYAVMLAVTWLISTRQAADKTEALLDYAVLDLRDTVAGAVDTMLGYIAGSMVRDFGTAESGARASAQAFADRYGVDEVNIVDRSGRIISSNDSAVNGGSMLDKPESAAFMVLTNGTQSTFSQPFRAGALNPGVRRKYLGCAFPNGEGYVQIGIDESRLDKMLPTLLGYIFDEWLVGEKGCFLCADMKTGEMISNPSRHRDEAKTLAETGFDETRVPGAGEKLPSVEGLEASRTFRQKIFREPSYCRSYVYAGHRLIVVVPYSEYYGYRDLFVAVMAVLLAVVIAGFAVFIVRVVADADQLKEFYASEEAHRARDMTIAKKIQTSALPNLPPESDYFSVSAAMQAAKDVGGDFYDYFMLDATHIAFLVADVSGKGVTAALYMMTAKTLIKDILLKVRDPAAALTAVNEELCRCNPANMFLTAWVGVLDLESGVVAFVNAGHNPPLLLRTGESPQFIVAKSGPVLAFSESVSYSLRRVALRLGDTVLLYTDGVTEALDARGELFGNDRLVETLAAAAQLKPEEVCGLVRANVAAFAAGEPQADDITVLALRRDAAPRISTRSFPPTADGIAAASAFLDEVLKCPPAVESTAHIILDEICSNIVKHSGASGFEVNVELFDDPAGVKLTFSDDGEAYNPLSHVDPDTSLSVEERPIGGLGILMVKKMSDTVSYWRKNGHNFFTAVKRVKRAPPENSNT